MVRLKWLYWWLYYFFKIGYTYMFKVGVFADSQFNDTHWNKFKTLLYYSKVYANDMMTEE